MKKRTAYLLLFIATIIWGLAFIAQKYAAGLPAFAVNAYRSITATIFILALLPVMDKIKHNGRKIIKNKKPDITKRELVGGVILGIILSAATGCQQIGIGSTDAGKTAFITALYIVFVPIISGFFGKKSNASVWIAIPVSLVGFYLLCITPDVEINRSDLLVLLCAIIFAGHIVTVDMLGDADGIRLSLIQFATSSVVNAIIMLLTGGVPTMGATIAALPALLFLGIGSSGIAYTLQILGQQVIEPGVASIILSLEAVFGVIGSAIILGERMTIKEYIGCGVVLIAVLIAQADMDSIKNALSKSKKTDL